MRPFVRFWVAAHLRRRLFLLRRVVLTQSALPDPERDALISGIDRVLPLWTPRVLPTLYAYVLPVGIPLIAALGSDSLWLAATATVLALAYTFVLSVPAFAVKRALMLGGSVKTTLSPGQIDGQGAYGLEHRVFGPAVIRREFPVDAIVFPLLLGPVYVAVVAPTIDSWTTGLSAVVVGGVYFTILYFAIRPALRIRKRLGRW
jgi:hypothetical protein